MKKHVKTKLSESESRPRGRPRSAQARAAVLQAARDILDERGITAVTMEGVAERAGVGKPMLYRSWRNAHELAMAALLDSSGGETVARQSDEALADLRRQLRKVAAVFASRIGRQVAQVIAQSDEETELSKAFRTHFILARREEGRALLSEAMEQGAVRRDIDLDVALDMIYGPLFYRLLVGHKPLNAESTDTLLSHAVSGLAARKLK